MTAVRAHRRTVLRAAAGAAATLPMLAGCGVTGRPVEVTVSWSGTELDTFRRIVSDFQHTDRIGVAIDVVPGNEVDATLTARLRAGNPPDLAVFTEPGLITKYRPHLVPLDPDLAADVTAYWRHLAVRHGRLYGCWLKAAHKSLLWHRPGRAPGLSRWADLVELAARPSGTPLLSVGAADGWVLTDWFENLLAALDKHEYERLAGADPHWHSEPVATALRMLGRLWRLPGLFPGGPGRALLTTFDASVVDVFGTDRARLVFEGDFVAPVIASIGGTPSRREAVRFPSVGGTRPLVVGGDVIVALSDRPDTRRLLRHLVGRRARLPWVRQGFLVPSTRIRRDDYPTALSRRLADELTAPDADPRFDLSDRLAGQLAGDDGKGSWLIMQQFFRDVTTGVPVDTAVRRTCDAFQTAAEAQT
jgi:alpha-glucoside transport system substrate-binding protein